MVEIPDSQLMLSVIVIKTDKGPYPISGALYGPNDYMF